MNVIFLVYLFSDQADLGRVLWGAAVWRIHVQLDAWLRDLIGWCSKSEELEFYIHEFLNLEGSAEGDYAPADFKAPAVGYLEPSLVWTGILLSFIGL